MDRRRLLYLRVETSEAHDNDDMETVSINFLFSFAYSGMGLFRCVARNSSFDSTHSHRIYRWLVSWEPPVLCAVSGFSPALLTGAKDTFTCG